MYSLQKTQLKDLGMKEDMATNLIQHVCIALELFTPQEHARCLLALYLDLFHVELYFCIRLTSLMSPSRISYSLYYPKTLGNKHA